VTRGESGGERRGYEKNQTHEERKNVGNEKNRILQDRYKRQSEKSMSKMASDRQKFERMSENCEVRETGAIQIKL
jgi:hypothetical protein